MCTRRDVDRGRAGATFATMVRPGRAAADRTGSCASSPRATRDTGRPELGARVLLASGVHVVELAATGGGVWGSASLAGTARGRPRGRPPGLPRRPLPAPLDPPVGRLGGPRAPPVRLPRLALGIGRPLRRDPLSTGGAHSGSGLPSTSSTSSCATAWCGSASTPGRRAYSPVSGLRRSDHEAGGRRAVHLAGVARPPSGELHRSEPLRLGPRRVPRPARRAGAAGSRSDGGGRCVALRLPAARPRLGNEGSLWSATAPIRCSPCRGRSRSSLT